MAYDSCHMETRFLAGVASTWRRRGIEEPRGGQRRGGRMFATAHEIGDDLTEGHADGHPVAPEPRKPEEPANPGIPARGWDAVLPPDHAPCESRQRIFSRGVGICSPPTPLAPSASSQPCYPRRTRR